MNELIIINPADVPNWDDILLQSDIHHFFHTAQWAKVLEETYRFRPVYFTKFESGRITALMPFMEVHSLITGKRGVSLPFSDHCPIHLVEPDRFNTVKQDALEYGKLKNWKYLEWRESDYFSEATIPWEVYYFHMMDLAKSDSELMSALSSNTRRNIKKAINEGIEIKIEKSLDSMRRFFRLNLITRKRHGLPSQPFSFLKNVHDHIISRDYGRVISAYFKGTLIASSVYFHFGKRALYKYGASETEHQILRPNNLIMWEAMRWYRDKGMELLDLGRTEQGNLGLLRYKRTWGAHERLLNYYRFSLRENTYIKRLRNRFDRINPIMNRTPTLILRIIGRLLYRHVG